MTDSYQKIIDDMKYLINQGHDLESWYLLDEIREYADRLEALRAQPVAWMHFDGLTFALQDEKEDFNKRGVGSEYTIPLIRVD